jgi:hypothetical protein
VVRAGDSPEVLKAASGFLVLQREECPKMFEGLNLVFPALAVFTAMVAGFAFVFVGWVRFAAIADGEPRKSARKPLLAFTASVCFDFALFPVLSILDRTGLSYRYLFGDIAVPRIAFATGFVASVVLHLVVLGFGLTRRSADSISGIVKWGSITALLIEAGGCVLFAVAEHST